MIDILLMCVKIGTISTISLYCILMYFDRHAILFVSCNLIVTQYCLSFLRGCCVRRRKRAHIYHHTRHTRRSARCMVGGGGYTTDICARATCVFSSRSRDYNPRMRTSIRGRLIKMHSRHYLRQIFPFRTLCKK